DSAMNGNKSEYVKYLPEMLQSDEFLGWFLLAFEQVLTGTNDSNQECPGIINNSSDNPPGLEAVISAIHTYLYPQNPQKYPQEFLPWLASWVALSLRNDWGFETKSEFIKGIVPLYQKRGTKEGLEKVLSLYLKSLGFPEKVTIYEEDDYPDRYFQVELTLSQMEHSRYWQQVRIAKAIIEQEKPAHTYYGLKIQVPSMRITGNIYPLNLTSAGDISVNVTKKSESSPLRVSIKSRFGQAEPYKSTTEDSLTYTVTSEQFASSKNWYLIIDNLSDKLLTISLSIKCPGTNKIEKLSLSLQPGLKICKKNSDGTVNRTSGNTFLGTQRGGD
ncbi:MAG: phage tail protein, partial [Planktothrix sp.]